MTELHKLQAPLIHLNGSAREQLSNSLKNAMHGLLEAEDFVKATAPHARDYYPLGPDAFKVANDQHLDRLRRLEAVREELAELYCKVEGL